MTNHPKFKIYKNILCLETPSDDGGKWWYQSGTLAYTALPVYEVQHYRIGQLQGSSRYVLAVAYNGEWVAVNLPRSDVPALKAAGLWRETLPTPYEKIKEYAHPPIKKPG